MTTQVLIDAAGHAALVRDGQLEDVLPATKDAPQPGDLFWAKVDRKVAAMGGSFLRLTGMDQGFLKETKGLQDGKGALVQVSGHAEPGKAVPVSLRILIKSRHVILTPEAEGVNVSRQIRGDERDRLTAIAEPLLAGHGAILRSAASGAAEDDIAADVQLVLDRWARVQEVVRGAPPAVALKLTAGDVARAEWGGPVREGKDLFEKSGILDELQRVSLPDYPLPSGGSITVEATRALVAVDVNTGPKFSPGAAMTANIEACRELPRQLRLRGLGGQIIVDFAPLKKMHRKKIEEELKRAFRQCPVETQFVGWSALGLAELSRKRERRPLTL